MSLACVMSPVRFSSLSITILCTHVIPIGMLGSLPPPAWLVSVSVSAGSGLSSMPASMGSLSSSSGLYVNSYAYHHPAVSNISAFPSTLTPRVTALTCPGMILSPAADPILYSLVQHIQSGQFVKKQDLLADNIVLFSQLPPMNGVPHLPADILNNTRFREVPSLVSWLHCFTAYVAVRMADPVTRDMLAYSRFIIREALRHGSSGWLDYDCVFRRQVVINPLLSWNVIEPSLQATTILGQRSGTGTFCTLCHECDHLATHCALAPLQQNLLPVPAPPIAQ